MDPVVYRRDKPILKILCVVQKPGIEYIKINKKKWTRKATLRKRTKNFSQQKKTSNRIEYGAGLAICLNI